MAEPFVGEIRMFPYTFPPRGWAYCDGQTLPIAQNPVLYAVISDFWGGDGHATLGLPDLQGRAPMHSGRGPGLSNRRFTEQGGVSQVPLMESVIPSHHHSANVVNKVGNQIVGTGHYLSNASGVTEYKGQPDLADLRPMANQALSETGGGAAHENRQPYLVAPFCIALDGIYPPRS